MTGIFVRAIVIALFIGLVGGYALTWSGQFLTSVLRTDVRALPTAVVSVFALILVAYVIREATKLLAAFGGGEKTEEK